MLAHGPGSATHSPITPATIFTASGLGLLTKVAMSAFKVEGCRKKSWSATQKRSYLAEISPNC
jgi:hypothetical protein